MPSWACIIIAGVNFCFYLLAMMFFSLPTASSSFVCSIPRFMREWQMGPTSVIVKGTASRSGVFNPVPSHEHIQYAATVDSYESPASDGSCHHRVDRVHSHNRILEIQLRKDGNWVWCPFSLSPHSFHYCPSIQTIVCFLSTTQYNHDYYGRRCQYGYLSFG